MIKINDEENNKKIPCYVNNGYTENYGKITNIDYAYQPYFDKVINYITEHSNYNYQWYGDLSYYQEQSNKIKFDKNRYIIHHIFQFQSIIFIDNYCDYLYISTNNDRTLLDNNDRSLLDYYTKNKSKYILPDIMIDHIKKINNFNIIHFDFIKSIVEDYYKKCVEYSNKLKKDNKNNKLNELINKLTNKNKELTIDNAKLTIENYELTSENKQLVDNNLITNKKLVDDNNKLVYDNAKLIINNRG